MTGPQSAQNGGGMPSVQRMIRALGQGLLLLGFAIFDLSALADSVWVSELQNEVTRGQVDKIKEDDNRNMLSCCNNSIFF